AFSLSGRLMVTTAIGSSRSTTMYCPGTVASSYVWMHGRRRQRPYTIIRYSTRYTSAAPRCTRLS
ncbi:MAG TPA: hypothetical protein VKT52_04690, partial [Ktedonobacterales bacterium]|nr:hypothetical protein [Ktedonobacterales bacterium]